MNTIEIKAKRNNKEITLTVEVESCNGKPQWVTKENGKPLYSTTGYIHKFNGVMSIQSYRGKMLLDEVEGLEVLEGFETISEENRDLWIKGEDGLTRSPEEHAAKFA